MSKRTENKVEFSTLNVSRQFAERVKIYAIHAGRTVRWVVETAVDEYMNSNQAPTSFHPTPEQQVIIDNAKSKYPYSAPKKNTDKEVVGITKDGDEVIFEPNEEPQGLE